MNNTTQQDLLQRVVRTFLTVKLSDFFDKPKMLKISGNITKNAKLNAYRWSQNTSFKSIYNYFW